MLTPKQLEKIILVIQHKLAQPMSYGFDASERDTADDEFAEEWERAGDARDEENSIWRQARETERLEWISVSSNSM